MDEGDGSFAAFVVPFPLDAASVEAITDGGISLGRVVLLAHSADFGD
jgi:hypothetical protein